jgi:hypothetical protein
MAAASATYLPYIFKFIAFMENGFIGLPPHSEGVRGTLESFPVEISCAWRGCGYRSTRGGRGLFYQIEGKVGGGG